MRCSRNSWKPYTNGPNTGVNKILRLKMLRSSSLALRSFATFRRPVNAVKPSNRLTVKKKSKIVDALTADRTDHLPGEHALSWLLTRPALIVGRQFEAMNLFLGFEQASKYVVKDASDPEGSSPIGQIFEHEMSFVSAIQRQLFRSHRPFTATIATADGRVALELRRPFAFINSRLSVFSDDNQLIGQVIQRWHPWRRRYDLVVGDTQFAEIDAPFLSWDFQLKDEKGDLLGSVNKNFTGFGREILTDMHKYILWMDTVAGDDQAQHAKRSMTVNERAVALAAAISCDFDYFSRRNSGGIFRWLPFFGGGGSDD